MSRLYLVRHGQASFFSDDYDKLSEMGEEQAAELARFWIAKGVRPAEVFTGTLQRQRRTAEVVGEIFRAEGLAWPEHEIIEGLNEYPADQMMALLLPCLCENDERFRALSEAYESATGERERYVTFHRLLEAVMAEWIAGGHELDGMPRWKEFHQGVRDSLKTIFSKPGGGREVAVFSSGGVIGVCVQTALESPPLKAAELNWRIHNGSVTQFTFSDHGARLALDSFNDIAHFTKEEHLTFR